MAFILSRLCLFLALILCIDVFVLRMSCLLMMKLIYDSVYWHGTGTPSNCLNRIIHEVLGCAPA